MSDELLLIVDCNNMVIRAHSGMLKAGLATKAGIPTGGLFGSVRALNRHIQILKPTHIACFWDFGRSSFRTAIASDYKGDRPSKSEYMKPGDLQETFRLFEEYLNLIRVFHYKEENVEADDLIANCVSDHRDEIPITILSADHDLRQLVRQPDPYPVTVVKPSMSSTKPNEMIYTYQTVVDEYKLPPHRLAEIWAIEGDTGDNVKGVPGFGAVKSFRAIQDYGSLSNAIANHPKLAGYERQIYNNYRMIKLPSEVETAQHQLEDYIFPKMVINTDLRDFFELYELSSLVMKYDAGVLFDEETGMKSGFGHL